MSLTQNDEVTSSTSEARTSNEQLASYGTSDDSDQDSLSDAEPRAKRGKARPYEFDQNFLTFKEATSHVQEENGKK